MANKVISLVQPKREIIDQYRPCMVAAYMEYFATQVKDFAKAEVCRKSLIKGNACSVPATAELREVMSTVPYRVIKKTIF